MDSMDVDNEDPSHPEDLDLIPLTTPPLTCDSEVAANELFNHWLKNTELNDWNIKYKILKEIEEIAPSLIRYNIFKERITELETFFLLMLAEIRSTLVNCCVNMLNTLAIHGGIYLTSFFSRLLPQLFKCSVAKLTLISSSTENTIYSIIRHVPESVDNVILDSVLNGMISKNPFIRSKCFHFFLLMTIPELNSDWESRLESCFLKGLSDANNDVRRESRAGVCFLAPTHFQLAERLYMSMTLPSRKLFNVETKYAYFSDKDDIPKKATGIKKVMKPLIGKSTINSYDVSHKEDIRMQFDYESIPEVVVIDNTIKCVCKNGDLTTSETYLLLYKMLELNNPVIKPDMRDFLMKPEVFDIFLNIVTRITPACFACTLALDSAFDIPEARIYDPDTTTESGKKKQKKKKSPLDSESMSNLHSFKVTNLLTSGSIITNFIIKANPNLFMCLLTAFSPESKANLYHVASILKFLITKSPSIIKNITPAKGLLIFERIFLYMSEPAIPDLLMTMIVLPSDTVLENRNYMSSLLKNSNIMNRVIERFVSSDNNNFIAAHSYFFNLIFLMASHIENYDSLFLLFCNNDIITSLCKCFISESNKTAKERVRIELSYESNFKAEHTLKILSSITESCFKTSVPIVRVVDSVPVVQQVANLSLTHSNTYIDLFEPYVIQLFEILCNTDTVKICTSVDKLHHSIQLSYLVPASFSIFRLNLVSLMLSLVVHRMKYLSLINENMWRVLLSWWLEYKNNNIFQHKMLSLFKNIISLMVYGTTGGMESIDGIKLANSTMGYLFVKQKLLTKMLACYDTTPKTAFQSVILEVGNYFRLAAGILPSSSFTLYLSSHEAWRSFLPICKNSILEQEARKIPIPKNCFPSTRIIQEFDNDIEIGSVYAKNLGFDINLVPMNNHALLSESIVAIGSGSKKKKKKKKKTTETNAENNSESGVVPMEDDDE